MATAEHSATAARGSLLHVAVSRGYVNEIRRIVENNKTNIDLTDEEGRTPLMNALDKGHYEAGHVLIQAGCDVNRRDCHGNSALSEAAERGDLKALKLLLKTKSIDLDDQDSAGQTALHLAVLRGTTAATRMLIGAGCQLNIQDHNGFTPTYLAAWNPHNKNSLPILRTLLEAGANPDVCDDKDNSPIIMCWTKWFSLVSIIQHGCIVNGILMNGYSLVTVACFERDLRKVALLRATGARMEEELLALVPRTATEGSNQDAISVQETDKGGSTGLQEDFINYILEEMCSIPMSLKEISRIAIRRLLQRPLFINVRKLPVPSSIHSYLKLEEFS